MKKNSEKAEKKQKTEKKIKAESDIQSVVNHFFCSKGFCLDEIKENAKKRVIIYSRYTKPAKQLLELAGSKEKAMEAITKVAEWAKSRNLDYSIETVFKKWLELDTLKPKEIVKKPFFMNKPMVWSEAKHKWYVIDTTGEWLEFAGKEKQIEWRQTTGSDNKTPAGKSFQNDSIFSQEDF